MLLSTVPRRAFPVWLQEWMGKREITEKTFEFTPLHTFGFFVTVVAFPAWAYFNIKAGMQAKDAKIGRERKYM